MINVAEVLLDPDVTEEFQVLRATGSFANEGVYTVGSPTELDLVGNVQPAKLDDVLQVLPEGERTSNYIQVFCRQEIRLGDSDAQESDVIVWNDQTFRVMYAKNWSSYGYWHAIAEAFNG